MVKLDAARAKTESTLEKMNTLQMNTGDTVQIEKLCKALQLKKIDIMQLEKTKILGLYYNFQTQQRVALKKVTESTHILKDDLFAPYVHKERSE